MTKHNCDRCGHDEDAGCRAGLCDPYQEPPLQKKSPARLATEAKATNELSREFLLATLVEIVTAWDECDGPLMMSPEKGVPRFTKAIGAASAIVFGEGKRIP
jgi:hypothetical protein